MPSDEDSQTVVCCLYADESSKNCSDQDAITILGRGPSQNILLRSKYLQQRQAANIRFLEATNIGL